jgi:subtilisin family serine protease
MIVDRRALVLCIVILGTSLHPVPAAHAAEALSALLSEKFPDALKEDRAYLSEPFIQRIKPASAAEAAPPAATVVANLSTELTHLNDMLIQYQAQPAPCGGADCAATDSALSVHNGIVTAMTGLQGSLAAATAAAAASGEDLSAVTPPPPVALPPETPEPPVPATEASQPKLWGLPIQQDTYLLLLRKTATATQIDVLLKKYDLRVAQVIPEIGFLIVQANQPSSGGGASTPAPGISASDVETTLAARMRHEPPVLTAAVNVPLGTAIVPPASTTMGSDAKGNIESWDWRVGPATPSSNATDGNWGLKATRFPAAWNFTDAIKARGSTSVLVGVIDDGFSTHEDIHFEPSVLGLGTSQDHGNHVAGIVGSLWGNQLGVDGASPFVKLSAAAVPDVTIATTPFPTIMPVYSEIIVSVFRYIRNTPNVKVINLSLTYNWMASYHRNSDTDAEVQGMVVTHGLFARALADFAAERGIILVSAAGNDSTADSKVSAHYASPFNWAAQDPTNGAPNKNVLVVESVGRGQQRSSFSNTGGDLSAPGEGILSTVASRAGLPTNNAYGVLSGTSMAAPYVTALVALLYAYNPALTMDQVIQIVHSSASKLGNAAPRIDAFEALLRARKGSLLDLADLNHDGKVDMQDFQLFKQALQKAERADASVASADNVFPREDLNGSGRLSRDPGDRALVLGKSMSDLEVMMAAWTDTTVPAASLPSLLQ